MDVSVVVAKNQLSALLKAVEGGESVVITRNGKPVAQLTSPPPAKRKVILGAMKGKITMSPGWDDPITLDQFLSGDF